jgi:predicted nucleotidyltransferase
VFVTKVDERAVVPGVDDAARRRLAGALDQDGVVSALLFGSQATGKAGALSDIDVAVWLDRRWRLATATAVRSI